MDLNFSSFNHPGPGLGINGLKIALKIIIIAIGCLTCFLKYSNPPCRVQLKSLEFTGYFS